MALRLDAHPPDTTAAEPAQVIA